MWTIRTLEGGAQVLTDGERMVSITEGQQAELANAPTKSEFQDILRKILRTEELPLDDVDLDSIRDAAAGVVLEKPAAARD